jgi:hypothetical protein
LTSPEWLADAAERLRVKQEEDEAKAERALQRKQRRRRKTEVIDLQHAIPTANEREDDEALEVEYVIITVMRNLRAPDELCVGQTASS